MKKEELKSSIARQMEIILSNSKDRSKSDKALKELLKLKETECNGFKLVDVPITGDEESINIRGAYTITRNRFATVFHSGGYDYVMRKDGYDVVMKNHTKSAHVPFDMLFDLYRKKNGEGLDDHESALYEVLLECVVCMCQVMNIASTSEHRQATLKMLVEKWFEEMSELLDKKLENVSGEDIENGNLLDFSEDAEN